MKKSALVLLMMGLIVCGCTASGGDDGTWLSNVDAAQKTATRLGRPILITSVALAAGFLVVCLSNFQPIRQFGALTSAAMVVALLADLFLLPSEMESFGLSALEAMACEVPVIASNTGGIPEVVVDGETGFLHPVGDTAAMAASAVELLLDENRLKSFGRAGRRRAIDEFSIDDIVGRYRALYERVIAG